MKKSHEQIARECLQGAYNDTMSFPQIVGALIDAGFEAYNIDFRTHRAVYYLPNGETIEIKTDKSSAAISEKFDKSKLRAAIIEAQTGAVGYTYKGFCEKVMSAGCASYFVTFLGKRVLYIGRDGEIHTENFPN